MPFPGLSSSGVWRARSLRLVAFSASAAQLSGWTAGAPCEADGDCPAPPEVLAKKPVCSLVSKVSPSLQLPLSSPYGSGCLSPAGDGLQPAFSIPSFVLCSVLVVSYVRAFRVVAIPQSGLLAQVRSFWLRVGRSCPILTKLCSPRLPRVPALPPLPSGGCRRLCCFSAGGVTGGLAPCTGVPLGEREQKMTKCERVRIIVKNKHEVSRGTKDGFGISRNCGSSSLLPQQQQQSL